MRKIQNLTEHLRDCGWYGLFLLAEINGFFYVHPNDDFGLISVVYFGSVLGGIITNYQRITSRENIKIKNVNLSERFARMYEEYEELNMD